MGSTPNHTRRSLRSPPLTIPRFVKAAAEINEGRATAAEFDADLPTGRVTEAVTAILEAGRRSLDNRGARVAITYSPDDWHQILGVEVAATD